MTERATPPRPHHKLTEDGRRKREVLSYSRRGSRFTPRQQAAWDLHHQKWVVTEETAADEDFTWEQAFGRRAPMVVEIGSGVGEATAALAATRPDVDVLALEVWNPGVADTLWKLADVGADNVRLCTLDAAWTLAHRVAPRSVEEVWTFFPDPWPKTRHHKRRLVRADFAALVADRLVPGGTWRLATDWADYADQMRAVLDAEPGLVGGEVERWQERPVTRFERKGLDVGRTITDLAYTAR
ncbi:tRNA (guanine-N(7)-)-methyltransferase [Nocardioides sp. AX2bis]|nr:tRNA (guanine-N(7)-)-methyltransferase [Nocardioides sp. AX2bis]